MSYRPTAEGEEIIFCKKCNSDYSLYYDSTGVVVSSSNCKCIKPKAKSLDEALKKLKGVLNGRRSKKS